MDIGKLCDLLATTGYRMNWRETIEDLYGPQCITVGREQIEIDETNFHRLAPRARDLFAVTGYRMSWHEYVFGSFAVRNRERAYRGLLSRIRRARESALRSRAVTALSPNN